VKPPQVGPLLAAGGGMCLAVSAAVLPQIPDVAWLLAGGSWLVAFAQARTAPEAGATSSSVACTTRSDVACTSRPSPLALVAEAAAAPSIDPVSVSGAVRLRAAAEVLLSDPEALVRSATHLGKCLAAGAIEGSRTGAVQHRILGDVVAGVLAGTADAPAVADGGWSSQAAAALLASRDPGECRPAEARAALAAALVDQAVRWEASGAWDLDPLTRGLVDAITAPAAVAGGRRGRVRGGHGGLRVVA
jgi:hypothetical protein